MDLVDPITLSIATGLRRSELLACLWDDFNERAGPLTVSGKIVRVQGKGLKRFDIGKTVSSLRVVPLPAFAVTALTERHASGSHTLLSIASAGNASASEYSCVHVAAANGYVKLHTCHSAPQALNQRSCLRF